MLSRANCIPGIGGGDHRGCVGLVIGSFLEMIGCRQIPGEVRPNCRFVLCKLVKLAADALMRLRNLVSAFEDQRLSGMELRVIRVPSGLSGMSMANTRRALSRVWLALAR